VTSRRLDADALLDLVSEMLRSEIAPLLPPEKRYAAAMMGNAIDISRREIAGEAETAEFALLDAIYDDGDGTLQQLARDIRSGRIEEGGFPQLRKLLKTQLAAELAVRNPRFLKMRKD